MKKNGRKNDEERRMWVQNDEGLYLWWLSTRTTLQSFVVKNRVEIDAEIDRALNVQPRS